MGAVSILNEVEGAIIEMDSKNKELRYGHQSVKGFERYFQIPPVKRGRGRPKGSKKKQRGRPKVAHTEAEAAAPKQTMFDLTKENELIDLTVKQADALDARLEGTLAKDERSKAKRINWDEAPHSQLRQRLANAWTKKNDVYSTGDSFGRFCIKVNIDRNVLHRFLNGKYKDNVQAKSRGRPSLLSKSVMRHLCEGW